MSFGCIWMNVNIESTVNKSIKANEQGDKKKKMLVKQSRKDGISNFSNFINSFFLLFSIKFFYAFFDEVKEAKMFYFSLCWSCWASWLWNLIGLILNLRQFSCSIQKKNVLNPQFLTEFMQRKKMRSRWSKK